MNPKTIDPKGLTTGIGSLPHLNANDALDGVLSALSECPFWPQLPALSHMEGMTLQYVSGFPGLRSDSAKLWVDTVEEGQAELTEFYEKSLSGDTDAFALPKDRAAGFYAFLEALQSGKLANAPYLKGHITGPVTLASSLKDANDREITYDVDFTEAVSALLAANAAWQIKILSAGGKKVIIFLDEPVMEVFGSAYSSLTAEMVNAMWEPVLTKINELGGYSGIHCCGNTDWGVLLGSGVDIVNFDAYSFMDKFTLYPKEIGRFLEKGGMLAWGIVPTDQRAEGETAQNLFAKMEEGIERLEAAGISRDLILKKAIITPSCGMGSLSVPLAEKILKLTDETGKLFRAKYFP